MLTPLIRNDGSQYGGVHQPSVCADAFTKGVEDDCVSREPFPVPVPVPLPASVLEPVPFLRSRRSTSTTMGSEATRNAATASSWEALETSLPFTRRTTKSMIP